MTYILDGQGSGEGCGYILNSEGLCLGWGSGSGDGLNTIMLGGSV
jgi:hypothetical protein